VIGLGRENTAMEDGMTGAPRNPASLRQMHGALTAVPSLYQRLTAIRNTSNTNALRRFSRAYWRAAKSYANLIWPC